MQELFATHINAFCALEVIVSAVVVLRFIRTESGSTTAWLALLALCWSAFRWARRYFCIFVNFNWNGRVWKRLLRLRKPPH